PPHPPHLPGGAVLEVGPADREEEGRRRRRPLHPGDLLAPAHPRLRLRRSGRGLLHPPQHRPPTRPPHPATPRPGLPRHPRQDRVGQLRSILFTGGSTAARRPPAPPG